MASSWLAEVRVATTGANITLSGLGTAIDGVTLAANDRVLVKDQTTASANGVYVAASGAWTRASDFATGTSSVTAEVSVRVSEGTTNAHTQWVLTTAGSINVGTTALTFQLASRSAWKDPVRAATTGSNITLSGLQTVDGVALAANDRVLVKDQTTGAANGIYAASTGAWLRTTDANASALFGAETCVRVSEGTVNAGSEWQLVTANPITLGTTALQFSSTPAVGNDVAKSNGVTINRVTGFNGVPLDLTAPKLGQSYNYRSTDNKFASSRQVVHVDLFGAVADADGSATAGGLASKDGGTTAATDNTAAFQAAIRALDLVKGGIVELGFGGYRLASTVIVDRPVTVIGQGHAEFQTLSAGTMICVDKRQTAFRVAYAAGKGAMFKNTVVAAVAQDTAAVNGSFAHLTRTLTLASAGSFYNGQLIEIPGAGNRFTLARLFGATNAAQYGSTTLVITGSNAASSRGMKPGFYLLVGSAFPTPTQVVSIASTWAATTTTALGDIVAPTHYNGHQYAATSIGAAPHQTGAAEPAWPTGGGTVVDGNITWQDLGLEATGCKMAVAAAADATSQVVTYCSSRDTTIVSGGGTTTVVVDSDFGYAADIANVAVRDASAAFEMRARFKLDHVHIANFQGPGVAVLGGGTYVGSPNANTWSVVDCDAYRCRNAMICRGSDSQAGKAFGFVGFQSREWSFIDDTQAGNGWFGTHADGGCGFLVRDGVSAACFYSYTEGGTFNSFADRTIAIQGPGPDSGGTSWSDGAWNYARFGDAATHPHQLEVPPDFAYMAFRSPAGGAPLQVRRANSSQDGTTGYVLVDHSNANRHTSIAFVDYDGPSGYPSGDTILPFGFLLGATGANLVDPSVAIRITRADEEPVNELYYVNSLNPIYKTRAGDLVVITGQGSETAALLRCTRTGNCAPLWKALAAVAAGDRMRLNADDGYYYTANNTGTTGASEPASGATITDGIVTWTRQTASALFERVGGADGYTKHAITTSETWNPRDLQFLSGSVEVTGALTGDATLTLPAQKYTRWIWNNTANGHSLLVKCASGNTVTIANGKAAYVVCTGTEMRRKTADVTP